MKQSLGSLSGGSRMPYNTNARGFRDLARKEEMKLPQLKRRYLASYRVSQVSHRFTDVLVIGSGVAGSSAAIAAAAARPGMEVLLLAKSTLKECSTFYAQGGIAAVLAPEEN